MELIADSVGFQLKDPPYIVILEPNDQILHQTQMNKDAMKANKTFCSQILKKEEHVNVT